MTKPDKIAASPAAGPNILVGATGSVASIKIPQLLELLTLTLPEARIKLVCTQKSLAFFDLKDVAIGGKRGVVGVYTDADDWSTWKSRGDPVLHIELRDWADVALLAPCDANTLAKVANGLADNLITCILRAWRPGRVPVLIAPAMNTGMWENPLTSLHLDTVTRLLKFRVVPPIEKGLACGEHGMGAMAEPSDLVNQVVAALLNCTPLPLGV